MGVVWIPFDGWSPRASYHGDGWASARNLWAPYGEARPWRRFVGGTDVPDGPMVGRHVHQWVSSLTGGAYRPDEQTLFTGSLTRLYSITPSTGAMTDLSRGGLYTADSAGWRFASVGNDIWATNWIDAMQRRTNNAGAFADGVTSTFKPRPRFIASVREHLVGFNLSNVGRRQDELAWSDADNALNYDPASGTSTSLAGSKVLPEIPGQGTGLVGGLYGLAFKRDGIYYLEYTGTSQVFRPDVLAPGHGTAYPSSIIESEHGVFFLGKDGFYQIVGLSAPIKISTPGVEQYLIDSNFSANALGTFFPWIEDIQMVGFNATPWPLVGWVFRRNLGEHGNDLALLYNPISREWHAEDVADPNEGESLAARPTAVMSRPYADNQYETLAGLTWDGQNSRYRPLAATGTAGNLFSPALELRYRPANVETAHHQQQTRIDWVIPMFAKSSISGTALTETVTVNALLDPGANVWKTESAAAAVRDTISGAYPFTIAGRFFQILIPCAAEDFASFEGAYVSERLL